MMENGNSKISKKVQKSVWWLHMWRTSDIIETVISDNLILIKLCTQDIRLYFDTWNFKENTQGWRDLMHARDYEHLDSIQVTLGTSCDYKDQRHINWDNFNIDSPKMMNSAKCVSLKMHKNCMICLPITCRSTH